MTEPLKVLIVEDEALLAMELEALVEDAGHRVVGWAANSQEAVRMIDEQKADLVFIDIHLADGPTGIDVAAHARDAEGLSCVFMTANPKRIPDDFVGAVGVIAKPYTMSGLNAALRYLEEGVRRPPPSTSSPVGFTLAPSFLAAWGPSTA